MLYYLWIHRTRPALFSMPFFKAWAKRALTFPDLLQISLRRAILIARGASIGPTSCIGVARIDGPAARLQIKDSTFLGRVTVALHDKVEIGSHVCINDGVTILTASHDVADVDWTMFSKPITIGDYAWIGAGAIILPGVTIGQGGVVGAGAVVSKDVPDCAVAVGNPARILPDRRSRELRYDPVRFLAFQEAWLGPGFKSADAGS
jgi:acetyltransferase-like isoleucine patch superfamily enzyme